MAGLKLKNLNKTFGDVVAVNNVSFDVKDKEFVVLLGPSGCGKTTTLRCIAGLETPDSGEIYIGDTLVNDFAPKDRDVAMVFQSYALYPHMTVFDNMAFPLKMRKVPEVEREKMVKQTARLLRITSLLDRRPSQLSGGEAQRVALGRAIVRDPRVFLMDEPLSNLDAKLRIYMRAELKRLQKDLGVTTVYVTHDQVEAMSMSDTIVIMNQGELQQMGNAQEIFDHPANLFVAGFIGSPPMNLVDCTFIKKDDSYLLDAGSFEFSIPGGFSRAIKEKATSSELILGIRPEDIHINDARSPRTFIKGEVYLVEPLGSEIIVDLQLGDNLLKVKTSSSFVSPSNKKVWIGFSMEKIRLFDRKTEKAII